jgi:thiamine-monophosphate kinase
VTDSSLPLGPGGEFDRIRAIWARLGRRAAGVGGDAAVVSMGGARLALSCDASLEGRHFLLDWLRPEEIGWRAGAAALSDLAAVAADPAGVLATVGVPADRAGDFLVRLMDGLGDAAQAAGAVLWGGDLIQSERVLVDVFVVGRADRPVQRRGAAPGDGLWVTGALGGPRAAVAAWRAGSPPGAAARERFARPVPRIAEARWLRDCGATAMIDLSDGLTGDAGHLAAASGVSLRIAAETVPRHPAADGWEAAVAGGEEYELLAAMRPDFGPDHAAEFAARFGLPLTRVGAVDSGAGLTLEYQGRRVEAPDAFSHF